MALPRIAPYSLPTAAELPQARGAWRPQRDRVALLVHDMQRYFLAAFAQDDAPLAPAVQNLARLLAHCRSAGIPVFYTAQRGHQDRRDRGLQADLWGPGMQAIAEHEAIIVALAPADGDHVLVNGQKQPVMEAVAESWRAVANHPAPMAFWAVLIGLLVGVGMFTALLGLVVVIPLIAHASWHAYRAAVQRLPADANAAQEPV